MVGMPKGELTEGSSRREMRLIGPRSEATQYGTDEMRHTR